MPRRRVTQRYCKSLLWACETYKDLKSVRKAYRCSSGFIYKTLYQQLKQKVQSKVNYPWPERIGIDEHFFSRTGRFKTFATVVVDMKNKRPRSLVEGKTKAELYHGLASIPGRENVRWVAMDMSDTYKSFVKEFFPKAQIVADKFHVLRLLSPHILRRRKEITPTRANKKAKKLLLCSSKKLDYFDRKAISSFLRKYPAMEELYRWKERLHGFYRIKGYERARKALNIMLIDMAFSKLPEILRLRRTLMRWKNEVLNYFVDRMTNARTEGFNNVAKLVQKQAYGYKSFYNYKLRYLSICS
jgi:transposase